MPLIIGVAGAIATGKSSACKTLERHGVVHCDADKLVHTLYEPGKPAFDRIVAAFGDDVVGADGFIDRRILGAKVFGKPEEMKRLGTAIGNIREAVDVVVDDWHATLSKADVAIMEAVSLIEAGYGEFCHQVWLFATCDQQLARQRLMSRNNFTEAEADQRLASQRPWKRRRRPWLCCAWNRCPWRCCPWRRRVPTSDRSDGVDRPDRCRQPVTRSDSSRTSAAAVARAAEY